MADISKFMAEELADAWELAAESDTNKSPLRRETLRECADMIRMLANRAPLECPRAPAPLRYCPDFDGSFPCQLPGKNQP